MFFVCDLFANSERFVIFYNFTVCEHVPNSHKKTCSHNQNVHISQRSHKEECTVYIYGQELDQAGIQGKKNVGA